MSLCILSVAYPFAPVGPDAVGGAEQVLAGLDAALVRAGHRSMVVAREGSTVAGELLATPAAPGTLTDAVRRDIHEAHRHNVVRALESCPVDVIHLHGVDFHQYLPPPGAPALITLHLPPAWYPPSIWRGLRPDTYLHCVSATQQRACPPGAELLPVIENGVPIEALNARCSRRRFALALGRICPEKNLHTAIDAARQAGIGLVLAGEVFPYEAHRSYFNAEIVPRLGPACRFVGPLGFRRKRRLLSAARCLLVPSLAPETSSLVAMEALACGTPVIAFPAGALPEIVDHGRTGFIVRDAREMAEAIAAVEQIDPMTCRETARERFSLDRTVERYFEAYEHLARGEIHRAVFRGYLPRPGLLDARVAQAPRLGTGAASRSMAPRDVSPAPAYHVERLTTTEALQHIRPEWSQLCDEDPRTTPFRSPEWLIPWWRHIGEGRLHALSVRAPRAGSGPGRLIGILPLYVYTQPGAGRRELLPVGVATTDYLDVTLRPGCEKAALCAAFESLGADSADWDACDLQQLCPDSPLLSAGAPRTWQSTVTPGESTFVLPLPDRVEDLSRTLPAGMFQNVRYYRRRAARAGSIRYQCAGPADAFEFLEALLSLHAARWRTRGEAGVLADEHVIRAHREALPGLLAAGVLRLHALRLDGRIIAVLYGLTDRRMHPRFYYYLGGFDPVCERLSPGTLLIAHAMEQAIQESCGEFDFLRGNESYKRLWGARERPLYRRRLAHGRHAPRQRVGAHAVGVAEPLDRRASP